MTDTPAPFPPALETAITQAVAGHRYYPTIMECSCTDEVENARSLDWEDWAEHFAAVVMETIAQYAPLEFSVSIDGVVPALQGRHSTMGSALAYVQANNEACNGELRHAVVARPTFPWQEVKA